MSLPVKSFVDYFSDETKKYWDKSRSDAKKCISQHEVFSAEEVDFSKHVESLDLTLLPIKEEEVMRS